MVHWRLIISGHADGPANMAADEALLVSAAKNPDFTPAIRLYTWSMPCVTFGYFQKYSDFRNSSKQCTRRPTGGLAVVHGKDISYGFAAKNRDWPQVRDQEGSYTRFHGALKETLNAAGINAGFCDPKLKGSPAQNLCVQSVFSFDLQLDGKKILGSCQRRRGDALLQQGSLHVDPEKYFEKISFEAERVFAAAMNISIKRAGLNDFEIETASKLIEKYSGEEWNAKY